MLKRNNFKRKVKYFKRKIYSFLKKQKKVITFLFIFGVNFLFIKIAFDYYIENSKNTITQVFFDKKIISNPNFANLTLYTNQVLSGTNSVKNKFLKFKKESANIKSKFPFVDKINIEILDSKSIKVNYIFKKPKLIFIGSGMNFLVYSEKKIIPFKQTYLTGKLLQAPKLFLPKYLLQNTGLNLIFWKNSLNKILKYTYEINKAFPNCKAYYLAGAEYFKISCKKINYLLSLNKDINLQIQQLNLTKIKLPEKVSKAKEIDLGSLKSSIFIK